MARRSDGERGRPVSASTVRAWVELARLSNAPTVVTNVLAGVAIGVASGGAMPAAGRVGALTGAMLLLYVAGMIGNDVVDATIDAAERPERPIPSGRVSRKAAAVAAGLAFAAGIAVAATFSVPVLALTVLLAVCIGLYDVIHKRVAGSVVVMGACRSLVYLVATAAVAWPPDWPVASSLAAIIGGYIVTLTIVARVEARREAGRRRWLALVPPLVVLAPLVVVTPTVWTWAFLAAAVAVAWMVLVARRLLTTPPRIGDAVQGWLAGICLLDALVLALLDQTNLVGVAWLCFAVTVVAHRRVAGT